MTKPDQKPSWFSTRGFRGVLFGLFIVYLLAVWLIPKDLFTQLPSFLTDRGIGKPEIVLTIIGMVVTAIVAIPGFLAYRQDRRINEEKERYRLEEATEKLHEKDTQLETNLSHFREGSVKNFV